ncbi:ABC transporter substrate-binding protein [Paenibacillus sp. MMS20-IR301]|uniref:ABC transporter substrate-binding protein n=1 Tax=Paenibacillus sp. MMS20-IR301 TaxID=2895946 RepID=UPI0028EA5EBA|nr:ABC transporter substrate-binding protein [Paenibacillus sp. MMS20-IR301]WNS40787.1 ABC transporter substrate-binding protein [Paenibacillus sp. MMS20-IR301]
MMLTANLLAACSASNNNHPAGLQQSEPAAGSTKGEAPEESFDPQQMVDASGAKLEFDSKVEKVACVVSLCVDIMAELGMVPAAIGESGVRTIATAEEFYGEQGTTFPSIGGSFFEPNLEDIITVKPDLVIGLLGAHDSLREGLAGVVPVYLAQPKTYTDSITLLETMGKLTGRTGEAKAAAERFLGKLDEAKQKAPKDKKALIMYGSDVNFSIVTDSGLGGSVLKEISHYPFKVNDPSEDPYGEGSIQYSLEKLLEENPDVIFVESYSYSPGTKALSGQMQELPLWSKLKAVQEQNVIEVRSPIWGDGRGTRSLGILIDEALEALYPDKF